MSDDDLPEVTTEEAIAAAAAGTILVDVREQDEWNTVHATGARLVPLSELQQRVAELPEDSQFLVICQSGGRSARATAFLRREGFDAVNVAGGTSAWQAVGGPVVTGSVAAQA